MTTQIATSPAVTTTTDYDVVVVGAGFAGLYLLHQLRALGLSAHAYDAADNVGGTWYWNRYPGARCDITSVDYAYSFDADLEADWQWSEKYATQPEILAYLSHVADRFDLRSDITFSTRVDSAKWDEDAGIWNITVAGGDTVTARFYVMATGCLSLPKSPDVPGIENFAGPIYTTGTWPHEGVDFTGKRVAVIGTGSSGIQSIPLIAEQAKSVTVFQRTPNFSFPAHNGPFPTERAAAMIDDRDAYHQAAKKSGAGVPLKVTELNALDATEEERNARFEDVWAAGDLIGIMTVYADTLNNPDANKLFADFVRNKIRSIVADPVTAEILCPTTYPIASKRVCLDTNYYQTFNLDHVHLIDLHNTPITTVTASGIDTADASSEFDAIVLATGFDAMTGALVAVDIEGRDGLTLKQKWADGVQTYLGLATGGFPNLFTVTGPGSPSVQSNMAVSIEQHVEWICDTITHMDANELLTIEPTPGAEEGWSNHVNDFANITLLPIAKSWFNGSNVAGKNHQYLPYVGGVGGYRTICDEIVAADYLGFVFNDDQCNDGVIRRMQPDVNIMLEFLATLGLPPFETLEVDAARELSAALSDQSPAGPEVGEVLDGTLPGAVGDLGYRLYRPDTAGPHPIVAYFHGGGWVFGSATSDDSFCRDLCDRAGVIIVSVDYRHGPEDRFPAAADDGFAATQWLAQNAESLGGIAGQLAVAGWSAGGNVAAVVCQLAKDAGGPTLAGQCLLTPVVDGGFDWPSYEETAEGYVLTRSLMEWFLNHYVDDADRTSPKMAPLRATDLSGLPPAMVVTCEFDPLRDQGNAYAKALADAGVPTAHVQAHGQIHISVPAVGQIVSSIWVREEMGQALRGFFA